MHKSDKKIEKELTAITDGLKSSEKELVNYVREFYGYPTINHKMDYLDFIGIDSDSDERPIEWNDIIYYVFGCYVYFPKYRKDLVKTVPGGICSPLPRDFKTFLLIASKGILCYLGED